MSALITFQTMFGQAYFGKDHPVTKKVEGELPMSKARSKKHKLPIFAESASRRRCFLLNAYICVDFGSTAVKYGPCRHGCLKPPLSYSCNRTASIRSASAWVRIPTYVLIDTMPAIGQC